MPLTRNEISVQRLKSAYGVIQESLQVLAESIVKAEDNNLETIWCAWTKSTDLQIIGLVKLLKSLPTEIDIILTSNTLGADPPQKTAREVLSVKAAKRRAKKKNKSNLDEG